MPEASGHYVYVLRCGDGSLYTGYTTNVARRLAVHAAGKGARYTRARLPVALCTWWSHPTREAALRAEWAFKQLTRREKLHRLALNGAETRRAGVSTAPLYVDRDEGGL